MDAAGSGMREAEPAGLAVRTPAGVMVYAVATGLAGAIPVPLLDGVFSELARGAAMRRVAARHGVHLTPGARDILSASGSTSATSSGRARLIKAALSSALAPLRVASRLEDGAGTLFASVLLDRFLSRPERPRGAALTESEARRVRRAVEEAVQEAGFDALRSVPLGVFDVLQGALRAAVTADPEERQPVERFVDAVLDGIADAPVSAYEVIAAHFDRALEQEGAE